MTFLSELFFRRSESHKEGERLFELGVEAAQRFQTEAAIQLYSKSIEIAAGPSCGARIRSEARKSICRGSCQRNCADGIAYGAVQERAQGEAATRLAAERCQARSRKDFLRSVRSRFQAMERARIY